MFLLLESFSHVKEKNNKKKKKLTSKQGILIGRLNSGVYMYMYTFSSKIETNETSKQHEAKAHLYRF